MRKIELKKCRKCGKTYVWKSGGFVPGIMDHADYGMCAKCRVKYAKTIFEK